MASSTAELPVEMWEEIKSYLNLSDILLLLSMSTPTTTSRPRVWRLYARDLRRAVHDTLETIFRVLNPARSQDEATLSAWLSYISLHPRLCISLNCARFIQTVGQGLSKGQPIPECTGSLATEKDVPTWERGGNLIRHWRQQFDF